MIKRIVLLALLTLNTSSLLLADTVVLYTWEDYISLDIGKRFTQATGHQLEILAYSDDRARNRTLLHGRKKIDLVILGSNDLHFMQRLEKFTDLSSADIPNKKHINDNWQQYCGDYGLAYSYGTTGIAYRSSMAKKPIQSLADFFYPDPALSGNIVYSLDDSLLVETANFMINPEDSASLSTQLGAITQLVKDHSKHVLAYEHGANYARTHGADSQMAMTLTYSSDLDYLASTTQQDDWEYVVPEEGTFLWVDCMATPSYRSLSPATIVFLEFINRPDIAAHNAEAVWLATANSSALKHTSEAYRKAPALIIDAATEKKIWLRQDLDQVNFTLYRNLTRQLSEQTKDLKHSKDKTL